jgi:hypothetical protein
MGSADAVYFYFGGTDAPATEDDTSTGAFVVGLSIYDGVFQARLANPAVSVQEPYSAARGVWIPVSIVFTRKTDTSFFVSAFVNGAQVLGTAVDNAGGWLSASSLDYWGIGARTGWETGTFFFKALGVTKGESSALSSLLPLWFQCEHSFAAT